MADAKKISKNAQKEVKSTNVLKFIQYTQAALLQTILHQADVINNQRRMILGSFAVSITLAIAVVFMATRPLPEPEYFGRDKDGHYFNLIPLDKNEIHETKIRLWAEACVINSLDLSFVNTLRRINNILNECFSEQGKASYQKWLLAGTSNQTIKYENNTVYLDSEFGQIIDKEITLSASPKSPSRIRQIDPITHPDTGEKILRWEVTFPILLRKDEGGEAGTGNVVSRTILSRTNNTKFEYGVAIDSYSLTKQR